MSNIYIYYVLNINDHIIVNLVMDTSLFLAQVYYCNEDKLWKNVTKHINIIYHECMIH